jgi:uncharacterized membrane protein
MKVHFKNSYPSTVWVAVMYYDPDGCDEYGDWATAGWWKLDPGQKKWPFSTSNRYAAFYAEAADGAVWSGPYGPVYVYQSAFDSCVNIGSTAAIDVVGMRLIDLGSLAWVPWANHTVNLVP